MACDVSRLLHFSKTKQELVAMCIDHYANVLKNYVSDKVKTDDTTIDQQIRERMLKEVFHGEPFNHRTYRKYQNDFFEVIEVTMDQSIPDGWRDNPVWNRFVEERRLDLGDTNEFYINGNSLLTVSKFSGNHWDTNRERFDLGSSTSVPTSWFVAHFYNEAERFMKEIDSFITMMNKVTASFLNSFYGASYTAFADIANYVPEEFSGKGTLATAAEKKALLLLRDKIETANNSTAIFVGTKTALRELQGTIDDHWISDSMQNERNRNGIISTWEGTELLPLPNVFKRGTFDFMIPTNKILIVTTNATPIKFVYEGNTRIKEVQTIQENQDMTLEYQAQVKAGVGVVIDSVVGEWEIA